MLSTGSPTGIRRFHAAWVVLSFLHLVAAQAGDGWRGGGRRNTGTSSVAMIILYSVTGVITLMFLAVIATGAVRAHRNPDRFGPRNIPGRPRQSRARGLARAMLETIPIVKFSGLDEPAAAPGKTDVELASQDGGRDLEAGSGDTQTGETIERRDSAGAGVGAPTAVRPPSDGSRTSKDGTAAPTEGARQEPEGRESIEIGPASPTARSTSPNNDTPERRGLMCSICTEEFVKGEDVRLLPCNHKYHPQCIDPWLVNVSGTCPLCRIDLHPTPKQLSEGTVIGGHGELPPPLQDSGNAHTAVEGRNVSRGHRRLSSAYRQGTFSAIHMRDLTPEQRVEAMRTLRRAQHPQPSTSGAGAIQTTEDTPRGSRLSDRLRDRFRIYTRRHGEDTTPAPTPTPTPTPTPGDSIPTPTPPPAVHEQR